MFSYVAVLCIRDIRDGDVRKNNAHYYVAVEDAGRHPILDSDVRKNNVHYFSLCRRRGCRPASSQRHKKK